MSMSNNRQNTNREYRAVENPISALFDLADDVSEHAQVVKKMVWYAIGFMLFWLFFDILIIIDNLTQNHVILIPILAGMFIAGILAIVLILQTHVFFKDFTRQYIGIKAVRQAEPIVTIPKGNTAAQRFMRYLRDSNPLFDKLLTDDPGSLQSQVTLTGRSGKMYSFSAYIRKEPSGLWKLFGVGNPGYALYINTYDGTPDLKQILELKDAVKDVTEQTQITPSRIVAISEMQNENFDGLNEDVYSNIIQEPLSDKIKGKTYTVNVQVVSETESNTYDFVPLIPELPDRLP